MALVPLKAHVPTDERPIANITIVAATILLSIAGFLDDGFLYKMMGVLPPSNDPLARLMGEAEVVRTMPACVSSVSSAFVHIGIIHLTGNMIFLWVFGNAVNYKFRHLGYMALYALAAFAGGMAHYLFNGTPVLGASGAICGIMGAFLVFFPRNDVTCVWLFGIFGSSFTLSSGWIILYWVVWDVGCLALGSSHNVAY